MSAAMRRAADVVTGRAGAGRLGGVGAQRATGWPAATTGASNRRRRGMLLPGSTAEEGRAFSEASGGGRLGKGSMLTSSRVLEDYERARKSSKKSTEGVYTVLSLDGGGVRGVYTAVLLGRLERACPGFLSR